MNDCVFCKIVKGEIPAKIVYQDEYVMAINDIAPNAKVHIVCFLKEHSFVSLNDTTSDNADLLTKIFVAIPKIADIAGVKEDGYRVISNCGDNAKQSVKHLHFHILGGEELPDALV